MMKAEFPPADHPRLALIASGIENGALRLREIINDMIDVSMIDMALLDLHFQPVWLQRLVESVEFDVRDTLKARKLTLTIERNKIPKTPTYADPERLHQVVLKVIANAIKYTPDGGTITISARDLPGFVDLTVTDTGIGIASENLTRIFEKFSSLSEVATHSSSKVKFKGGGQGWASPLRRASWKRTAARSGRTARATTRRNAQAARSTS
ncbi:MAG: HAMP domain-containing histidine kinase [Anaerolineae bacterium]|nr:HAMP domain-containing histidine kinase [Anaerolineae bacterium]